MTTNRTRRPVGPIISMGAGGVLIVAASLGLTPTLGADETPVAISHESGGITTTTLHDSGGETTTTDPETTTTVPETTTTTAETTTTTVPETTTTTVPETTTTTAATTTTTTSTTSTTVPETTTTVPETTTTVLETTTTGPTTTVPTSVQRSTLTRNPSALAITGNNSTTVALAGGALFLAGLGTMAFRAKREQHI